MRKKAEITLSITGAVLIIIAPLVVEGFGRWSIIISKGIFAGERVK